MKLIKLSYKVTDDSNSAPKCSLKVVSSEKVRGRNFGTSSPDWIVVNPTKVKVRAESYSKKGRTYKVNINCTDKVKNIATSVVSVIVKRKK